MVWSCTSAQSRAIAQWLKGAAAPTPRTRTKSGAKIDVRRGTQGCVGARMGTKGVYGGSVRGHLWSGVEWSGEEWSGAERSGAEWSALEWSGAERSGAELSGVEWSEAEWSGVVS